MRYFILINFLFLQGCAAIIYQKDERPIVTQIRNNKVNCIGEIKVILVSQSFGTYHTFPIENVREEDYKMQYHLVLDKVNELKKEDEICLDNIKTILEIKNIPVKEKRILALLNIVSFGIIPYFDEFTNSVVMKSYSKDGVFLGEISSSVTYQMVHSIFLWPVMPFYINGTNSLNLKLIPIHFESIKNYSKKEIK